MKFSLDLQYAQDDLIVIKGKGQFDTFYIPSFMQKVEGVAKGIEPRAIGYDFSEVPFMNSTALGGVIRAGKFLNANSPPIQHFLINPTHIYVHQIMGQIGILDTFVPYRTISQVLEELAAKA